MNSSLRMIAAVAAVLTATHAPATPPNLAALEEGQLGRAYVTIPYSELRALWEAGQRAKDSEKDTEKAPPVAALVNSMECHLRFGTESTAVEAGFEVETIASGWQTVPIIRGDIRIDAVEAKSGQVIWADDAFALLTNQPGKNSANLRLTAPGLGTTPAGTAFALGFGQATVKKLHVSGLPAGHELRVDGTRVPLDAEGNGSLAIASGPAVHRIAVAKLQVEQPAAPSRWRTQAQVVTRSTEDRLQYQARVSAQADQGSGLEMKLTLPGSATAVEVAGEDIAKTTNTRMPDGQRQVLVQWTTPDVLYRQVQVKYSVPQAPGVESWQLHAPQAAEGEDARATFAIALTDGLELSGDNVRQAVPVQQLPPWMREQIRGASFALRDGGTHAEVKVKWLPTIAAAQAIVTSATADLRVAPDGASHTALTFTIRHQDSLAWKLELPPGVEVLSCTVGGRASRPVQREGGAIELHLPAPADVAKGSSVVALSFAGKTTAFDPVGGQVTLDLPRTALFIERLDWTASIPEQFEVTAAQGNVTLVSAGAPQQQQQSGMTAIALRKDLCRGERPTVDLFYQRRGINN